MVSVIQTAIYQQYPVRIQLQATAVCVPQVFGSDSETCDVRMDVFVPLLAKGKNIAKSALTSVRGFFANGAGTFQNTLFCRFFGIEHSDIQQIALPQSIARETDGWQQSSLLTRPLPLQLCEGHRCTFCALHHVVHRQTLGVHAPPNQDTRAFAVSGTHYGDSVEHEVALTIAHKVNVSDERVSYSMSQQAKLRETTDTETMCHMRATALNTEMA